MTVSLCWLIATNVLIVIGFGLAGYFYGRMRNAEAQAEVLVYAWGKLNNAPLIGEIEEFLYEKSVEEKGGDQ